MSYQGAITPSFILLALLAAACASSPARNTKTTTPLTTLAPAEAVAVDKAEAITDFDLHVAQLKKRLPSNDFTIVVQPPFVVIGDQPPETVKYRAEETVKWTVDKLKQDYFTEDPKEILDIWLFKDAASYEKNARLLFHDQPSTPYGYYSREHKALIMNISTGGGTLVHEIVHPFMEANFPDCPPWLNEGMGSLYERVGEENGHIWLRQLASAGFAEGHQRRKCPIVQDTDGERSKRFLRRRHGSELRPVALSPLLPPAKETAGEVLQTVSREAQARCERVPNTEGGAG